jgi:16S rRNA (cytosine1402-N4)-methyltransferase
MRHVPVMVDEVQQYLIHRHTKLILDGTVACGGHASAILESNPDVELIGIDRDGDAIRIAETVLKPYANRFQLVRGSYTDAARILGDPGVLGESGAVGRSGNLDGVLLDLGLSSLQLDEPSRGFSHQFDGPLDMRMSNEGKTAKHLIEESSVDDLHRILREYGEVAGARRIARAIKRASDEVEMSTTYDLKRAIESRTGARAAPAVFSRVFQALRIALNGELDNINAFLNLIPGCMNAGGRIVVISYHSLEDRLIKNFFKQQSARCVCPPSVPVCVCNQVPSIKLLTRRVVKPSAAEVTGNPRSRSARLRAAEVVNPPKRCET